jgi:cell division protein FtsW (lipid II flippase)
MKIIGREKHSLSTEKQLIAVLLVVIGLLGCIAIYNSKSFEPNSLFFVYRQVLWILSGTVIYYTTSNIPFLTYKKYILQLNFLFWVPLVFVFLFGNKVNGMHGWFVLLKDGFPIYIQPAELAKPIYILSLSILCTKYSKEPLKIILLFLLYTFWTIPIILEPDFGTALIYGFAFIAVYWLSGGKKLYLCFFAGVSMLSAFTFILYNPYVIKRITAFMNPLKDPDGAGWHILQFKYAIARGGLSGSGLGKAYWSNYYLPLSHTDSIFSSIVESIGIIGIIPLLFSFIILFYIIYIIVIQQNNKLLTIFSCSIIACITFQALIHISVNVGIFPPTGITLPLISYGGSSFASTMFSFGMLMSIATYQNKINNS